MYLYVDHINNCDAWIDGAPHIRSKSEKSKPISKPLPSDHVSPEKSIESSRNVVSPSSSSTSKASSSSSLCDGVDLSKKTVIFSNVFDQNHCDYQYCEELHDKCLYYGIVDRFDVYTTHPDGIVKVLFRTRAAASYAILMMDGENFGNRILSATEWNEECNFDERDFVKTDKKGSNMPEDSPKSVENNEGLDLSISSPICSYDRQRNTNITAKTGPNWAVHEKKRLLKESEKRLKEIQKKERDAKKQVYVPILGTLAILFFFCLQAKGA